MNLEEYKKYESYCLRTAIYTLLFSVKILAINIDKRPKINFNPYEKFV